MTYPDGTPYTETDTRTKLINPALYDAGWTEDHIQRERSPGAVLVDAGGRGKRDTERVDDLLCLPIRDAQIPLPIAVIEAKAADKPYKLGLQQAKDYASRLNIPFVFASNGFKCSFYNDFIGITLDIDLVNFPSPADLRQIYEEKTGIHLDSVEALPLLTPYRGGQSARRYYQDAAIRAAFEKIAQGGSRLLISMATGTGKTLTAVHLLHRMAQARQLRKVLFLCDRTSLAEQAHTTLSRFFGDDAQIVSGKNPRKNARILVATYQTLNVGGDPFETGEARHDGKFFLEHYAENEFDVVVIDECHRSAWGQWSIVLTHNSAAIQIGLTATPRILVGGEARERQEDDIVTANNLAYFGEPVYEYTIAQAQADGYLAAAEIVKRVSSLDRLGGLTREELAAKRPTDPITGALKRYALDPDDPNRTSPHSWTLDFEARKRDTRELVAPLQARAKTLLIEADQLQKAIGKLKVQLRQAATKEEWDALQAQIDQHSDEQRAALKHARELENEARGILDAIYDLKAVNPNATDTGDRRTPNQLLTIIEEAQHEIGASISALRAERKSFFE